MDVGTYIALSNLLISIYQYQLGLLEILTFVVVISILFSISYGLLLSAKIDKLSKKIEQKDNTNN